MGNNIPEWQAKWLTYLVFILITVLSGITAFQYQSISKMQSALNTLPKEYVRLERYKTDQTRAECKLDKIAVKLDKIRDLIK